MENIKEQNKEESQNPNLIISPASIPNTIGMAQNPIDCLTNQNNDLAQDEQTKNNFIQKRNRMDDSKVENIDILQIDTEIENKTGEINDTSSDINMKSTYQQKNKGYQMNNHDQFICKKMSIDLDDDITNPSMASKKLMGCNCKNSGCLKRYCECFSRMKYCNSNCQCKNCFNNINFEKERAEAIKVYISKSPVSFKKINMDLNTITCNCKKSNCLKNYCECFQFGLKCTYSCGCVDCKNRNLFEKKLFFVENNCDNTKKSCQNTNVNSTDIKNSINNQNNNIIKLQEEETNINNINNINNKINKSNYIDKSENKKIINNPQFIVNKNVNNNNNITNGISPSKLKNRTRFFSFDDDMSQWNNLNLKTIEISNNKLIIDNYNVKKPDDFGYSYLGFQNNNFTNNLNNLNNSNNNMIITRKNSAFSAIIK